MHATQNETNSAARAAYSIAEISERYGISPGLVRLEISRGRLKAGRIGRRVILFEAAIQKWLDNANELR